MQMLMQLLETQETKPVFTFGKQRQADMEGAFAALLAALQHIAPDEDVDPELLAAMESLTVPEDGGLLFARLFAQPVPLDDATGASGGLTEETAEEGDAETLAVPVPVASDEDGEGASKETLGTTAAKTASGTVPATDTKDVPQQAGQTPAPTARIAGEQAAAPSGDGASESVQATLLRSEARYARVENRARAAEQKAASAAPVVKAATGEGTLAEETLGENLKLRLGTGATARSLAGGWQALSQLQPELAGTATQSGGLAHGMASVVQGGTGSSMATENAVPTQSTTPEPPTQVRTEHLGSDLVRTVRYLAGRESSSITVKLVPSNLGELQVEVLRRGDELSIRLTSSQANVRELLETQAHVLREQITRDGTVVHRVEISAGPNQDGGGHGSGTSREAGQQPQQQPNHPWTPQRRNHPEQDGAPTVPRFPERGMPASRGALNVMA